MARLMFGPGQFYNFVNKQKRFYVTPEEVAGGLRQLTNLDVHLGHPAVRTLVQKLDPGTHPLPPPQLLRRCGHGPTKESGEVGRRVLPLAASPLRPLFCSFPLEKGRAFFVCLSPGGLAWLPVTFSSSAAQRAAASGRAR